VDYPVEDYDKLFPFRGVERPDGRYEDMTILSGNPETTPRTFVYPGVTLPGTPRTYRVTLTYSFSEPADLHQGGLRKQSANTDVNLRPGETLVIAGMVRNEMSGAITKIPGLGDLPILGHLFRSKRFRQRESEMVVLITPRLSEQGSSPAADPRVQALQQRADALKKQFDMLD